MVACGYRTGIVFDPTRPNWHNTGDRPMAWSAWYPCPESDVAVPVTEAFFNMGSVVHDAPLIPGGQLHVVLLSHGTGGTAESLGWLARALALAGYVVIGANHHGNSGVEAYLPQGFLCWWERATDLSHLLTSLATEGPFAGRLDVCRTSVVGFSLGAHTAMTTAGARTSMSNFDAWCRTNGSAATGPKEFPDVADHIPKLLDTSSVFRQSWARRDDDVTDRRITSIIAIAPAPPIRSFTTNSVAELDVPALLITGGADVEAPNKHCAAWLLQKNEKFLHQGLGRHVGHYSFLEFPSDRSLVGKLDIFSDHPLIDRKKLHKRTTSIVLEHLK
ncbi:alpha/beta hydrolase family protein [Roseobacter sp.]|uniref:alpha/beta hydrolase family protein n=1 Tax=Roseobacter sp. TaxID=1907202 RepID=UPI00385A0877